LFGVVIFPDSRDFGKMAQKWFKSAFGGSLWASGGYVWSEVPYVSI
jgi:hypothetical protein